MLSSGKASHHQTTPWPTSQHPLHTRSRQVAKSSPAERIYRQLGERLGLSENPPCQTADSETQTAESRVGEPVAANGRSPMTTCDFPNTEHLKPKTFGEAETESIGTTSNHPFWSVDRQEFVQAGSLEIGERLQTLSGDVKVVQQKLPRPGPQPVFNLEVHNEHVYFVGQDGVLVHNGNEIYSINQQRGRYGAYVKAKNAAGESPISWEQFQARNKHRTWPANDGFDGATTDVSLSVGTKIDRCGSNWGRFVAPAGASRGSRALAPGTTSELRTFEVISSGVTGKQGRVLPWFGEPGKGTQIKLDRSILSLLKGRKIKRI